jgi:hypothetical protein
MGALRTLLTAALGKQALARAVILLAILAASAAFSQVAYAATEVKSNITTNTTWTTAGSPYILEQQVKVVSGVTLTIQPGVTVEFNGSDLLTFYIDGTLRAIGTESNPITFTSSQGAAGAGAPGQYEGVSLIGSAASAQLSFTHFEYGGTGSGGYYLYGVLAAQSGANLEVERSVFEHNEHSGLKLNDASAIVSHSTFAYNGDGISQLGTPPGSLTLIHSFVERNLEYGLFFDWASTSTSPGADLENNEITKNGKRGVYLEGSCSSPISTFPHGNGNDIYGNGPNIEEPADGSELGTLNHCEALPVDWTGNYWGSVEYVGGPIPLLNGSFICDDDIPADYYQTAASLQPRGYLAYSHSDPADPAPGPISTSSYLTFEPITCEEDGRTVIESKAYHNVYNSFYLAPGEISSEYIPIL